MVHVLESKKAACGAGRLWSYLFRSFQLFSGKYEARTSGKGVELGGLRIEKCKMGKESGQSAGSRQGHGRFTPSEKGDRVVFLCFVWCFF